jgi:hypothetical protein
MMFNLEQNRKLEKSEKGIEPSHRRSADNFLNCAEKVASHFVQFLNNSEMSVDKVLSHLARMRDV